MTGHQCNHKHTDKPTDENAANRRRLWKVILITGGYMVVEVVGGLLTNSVALLSDAGHMLTDVASLVLALMAIWFATRAATPQKSYGYHRLEIIAALINGITLLALSIWIIIEAIGRIGHPQTVQGFGMLLVATGGLMVNIIGAVWLHGGHKHSVNIRAAFYHVIGDLLGSIGAIIAGVLILTYKWYLADPILAIIIAILIIISAMGVIRETVDILLEATPTHLSLDEIRAALIALPKIQQIHDLHVWTITSGMYALSCHITVSTDDFTPQTLEIIRNEIQQKFDITHQTLQLETLETALFEGEHL
jgi:cobalt-zinc-cadmium efflux system protein